MARITFDRVTKCYGAVTAVDDLSFTLEPGSITGFIGVNGAGKSTALRVLARACGMSDARVEDVLELVELDQAAGRRVGGYSLGMRQRLGLAAALLGDPATLVLDEPANGLDPIGVRWLRGLLRSLADEGRTVLVSSHQLAELAQTVDDVVIIHHGRLITRGPTADLLAEHRSSTLEALFLDIVTGGPSV
jgi:ABC-2 type transport system ATP-binding protein